MTVTHRYNLWYNIGMAQNVIGDVFGRLTIIDSAPSYQPRNKTRWKVRCDCGVVKIVHQSALRQGVAMSCGCLNREKILATVTKHRKCGTPEYTVWQGMIQRCHYPSHRGYSNYGARGIRVCEEWRHSFVQFLADMGERPSPKHQIDRIDGTGNYTPDNCRWILQKDQFHNQRSNHNLTIDGRTQNLADWCREYSIPRARAYSRLKYGWNPKDALTEPPRIIRQPRDPKR